MRPHGARWQTPAFLRVRAVTPVAFMFVKSPSPSPLTLGPAIGAFAACIWHTLTRRA